MKSKKPLKQLIYDAAGEIDAPIDFAIGKSRMEIIGNDKILIENHKGILEYSNDIMKINCGDITAKISGMDLELKTLNINELSIEGLIISIEYLT